MMWLLALAAAQDCPPLSDAMEEARRLLVEEANLEASEEAVSRARPSLGCGAPVSATELGQYWVVRGAIEFSVGRTAEGKARLGAARRVAPGVWEPTLGQQLEGIWSKAQTPGVDGVLTIVPTFDVPLYLDGAEVQLPASVSPGVHLLQIVPNGQVVWGREVYVPSGEALTVDASSARLPDASEPVSPVPEPAEFPTASKRSLRMHVGTGAAMQAGPAFAPDGEAIETSLKAMVPAEWGLEVTTGPLRLRAALRGALLLAGRYAYAATDGDTMFIRSNVGGNVGVLVGGDHAFGGLGSFSVPGRLGAHGVWRWGVIGRNGALEVRPGVNLLTGGRPPEAQLDVLLTWSL